jgi:hypothetical protein
MHGAHSNWFGFTRPLAPTRKHAGHLLHANRDIDTHTCSGLGGKPDRTSWLEAATPVFVSSSCCSAATDVPASSPPSVACPLGPRARSVHAIVASCLEDRFGRGVADLKAI